MRELEALQRLDGHVDRELDTDLLNLIASNTRDPEERKLDFRVQIATNQRGAVVPAAAPQLLLLPNPATDYLQLDAGQRLSAEALTVHDAVGRRLLAPAQVLPDGRLELATATWPAGIYQLAVALPDGQVLHQKLLKQ